MPLAWVTAEPHAEHNDAALRRLLVAQEAARLLAGGEQVDIDQARRKAAARLGIRDEGELPDATQIREALAERQRLFGAAPAPALGLLRDAALQAMAFLAAFDPRLTGPVLAAVLPRLGAETNAMVRTTAVATELSGAPGENVLAKMRARRIGMTTVVSDRIPQIRPAARATTRRCIRLP